MVILNNIRYYLLGLALLFISNNTLGLTKNHPEIDTIRISFEYKDGVRYPIVTDWYSMLTIITNINYKEINQYV